jgi:hypothetical protein
MQGMVRPLRHELADTNYLDKDMVNAYPTLLYQLCVLHGYQDNVPHLRVLVEDREALLKYFMDKMKILDRDEVAATSPTRASAIHPPAP